MESRVEAFPAGTAHLDTVRALHQTVVSLRTALEVSKSELKELREKYQQHSQEDYADVIEKLTLENHILRRRIIDSSYNEEPNVDHNVNQNIKLEVTYSPKTQQESDQYSSDFVIKTATTDIVTEKIQVQESDTVSSEEEVDNQKEVEEGHQFCSTDKLNETSIEPLHETDNATTVTTEVSSLEVQTQIEDLPSEIVFSSKESTQDITGGFKTKLELLSRFDVKIKVRTINDGTLISSTTSETDSSVQERSKTSKSSKERRTFAQENKEYFVQTADNIKVKSVSSENIKMAVPNEVEVKSKNDKYNVQVRITSEENLVVKEGYERNRQKDTLNLDVDDLSFRSLSEGDNSVFSDGGTTPVDPSAQATEGQSRQYEQDGSGNESEEVDDIELIFTTDESKDMSNLQEDLVSIRDTEPWDPSPATTHSTPVLIKFHTLDPDFQPGGETSDNAENENQENSSLQGALAETSLKMKRVSLPSDKEIRHVAFNGKSLDFPGRGILKSCDNKSESMLYKRSPNVSTRRLDSVDSLTCEYNRNLSLDNTKSSSFELGSSSMELMQREESMDNFHKQAHLGHRFSVFAERDISKCGISEDDLSANLNRRNTCPNPFQFRPSYRGLTRPLGPLKATAAASGGRRVILRDGQAERRDNGAQTDVCAIPPRWSSDGYLAHKVGFSVGLSTLPTLPQRSAMATAPRRPAPLSRPPPPAPRPDHTRRQLLSDIGFTSMVPELSRSADPLWTLGQRASGNTSAEVTPGPSSATKFFSRGSSYRSPCMSIERSTDWTPQVVFAPPGYEPPRAWRSSLPDVRGEDTDSLLDEATAFLRRSGDDLRLHYGSHPAQYDNEVLGQPYIPSEPRRLRLGHAVKIITPQGRVALGRVRYVGLAGGTAAESGVMVGAVFPIGATGPATGLPLNDGMHRGRRYFHAPPGHTALFVPFQKVVMAWALCPE